MLISMIVRAAPPPECAGGLEALRALGVRFGRGDFLARPGPLA